MKKKLFAVLLVCIAKHVFAQVPATGLALWLSADKGISLSGPNVLVWKDQSNNNYDAVTKTSEYPQLIPHALNGKPVIRFNGQNNGMVTPPFVSFPSKRGAIFLIAKINGRSQTSGVGVSNFMATFHGSGKTWQFCATPTTYSYYDGSGSEGLPISHSIPTNWNMLTLVRSDDSTMKFFIGGRLEKTFIVNNNQPDINGLKIGFNGRLGGTALDSIPEVLNGDIAEIIIYNRLPDINETTAVHDYLSKKYDLELRPPPIWERWWFYVIALLLLLSVIIMIIQFIAQQKLKKQLAELQQQREMDKERQRISREMHDDIGAGLTQITMMSESAKNKITGGAGKELNDIAETSRQLVTSMSEIIWSLNPENKTLEQLAAYLREQLHKQLEYSGKNYFIEITDEGKSIVLSNEQRRNILLVTKELTNNALKYSTAQNIFIKMKLSQKTLVCSVEDDGKGFDTDKNYSGNGLKNIRHRIEELGGEFNISSVKGKGSIFKYIIPL